MIVNVERYQRKKYMNVSDSPVLFYLKQKKKDSKVVTTRAISDEIQNNSSLKRGEVLHVVEELLEQICKNLTSGNRVKLDGLGTFHMTFNCEGSEKEEDCTIKKISKVNVRFIPDKELKLVNGSNVTTRTPNAVEFVLEKKEKENGSGSGSGDGSGDGGDIVDPGA